MTDLVAGMEVNTLAGKSEVPLNSMFLTCVYGNFCWNFKKAPVHYYQAEVLSKKLCHGEFYLKLRKVSSTEFEVSLNRVYRDPSKQPDPGYFLEIFFTVVGHTERTQRKLMDHRADYAYHVYKYSGIDSYTKASNTWTVQCVVYMHEIFPLPNKAARRQNNLIKASVEDVIHCNAATGMMESLLNPKSLSIFSGRQDYAFAPFKAGFIERIMDWSRHVEKEQGLKAENVKLAQDVYLSYVLKTDFKPIDQNEVLNLYTFAQHLGLRSVVDACRDFMLRHLDDEYLVHVLENSVGTCDFKLILKAIIPFVRNRERIMKTKNWRDLLLKKIHTAQCILHIAQQRVEDFVSEELVKSDELYGVNVKSFIKKSPPENIETVDAN